MWGFEVRVLGLALGFRILSFGLAQDTSTEACDVPGTLILR